MYNRHEAHDNFKRLEQNPYPGRLVGAGMDLESNLIEFSAIMGRSANSRNRVYKADHQTGRVYTELAIPDEKADTSLIIYNAMKEGKVLFVASNGHQTDDVAEEGMTALEKWTYEPDAPNYTPRITVACSIKFGVQASFSIISRIADSGSLRILRAYSGAERSLIPGYGYYLSTYEGDGNPLPSFHGGPRPIPLSGDLEDIARTYWRALNRENRIAIAVKRVDRKTRESTIRILDKGSIG